MADGKPFNVFISWSGLRSKHVASSLREWVHMVIQAAAPWMSDTDVEKGSRSLAEISRALQDIKIGISCLTPENLHAPWLLYEAGSLSKTIDDKTRLCTYLLGGLENKDVAPPLGMFQHTKANREETRRLLDTINRAVSTTPLDDKTLDKLFDRFWPDLEKSIETMPPVPTVTRPKRSVEDMVAEILEFTRAETNRRNREPFAVTPLSAQNLVSYVPAINSEALLPGGVTFFEPEKTFYVKELTSTGERLVRLNGTEATEVDGTVVVTRRDGTKSRIANASIKNP